MTQMAYLHHVSFGIGALGVLVIVFGVAGGLARFLRAEILSLRGREVEADRKHLRPRARLLPPARIGIPDCRRHH